jgi:hypothetical protein
MSAAKSGWERNPTVAEIGDLIADIHKRLDAIEGESLRRRQAAEASKAFRDAAA